MYLNVWWFQYAIIHVQYYGLTSYIQLSGYSGNARDSLSQLVGNALTSKVKDIFDPDDCPSNDRFTGKYFENI